MGTRKLELGARALCFDELGDPSAAPVVLMHGLSMDRTSWGVVAPRLAERYRVFAFDHRGHGESTHTPNAYGVGDYAADAALFIDQVVGEDAGIVGHSLGGLAAAHLCAARPDLVRCALLEDPPLYSGDPEVFATTILSGWFTAIQPTLRGIHERNASVEDLASIIGAFPAVAAEGTIGEQLGRHVVRQMAVALHAMDPEALSAPIDGSLHDGFDAARPIATPLRVLRADRHPCFSAEDAATFLATHRHAEVSLVAGAGHVIHDDQPDVFVTDVLGFLGRHLRR